MAIDPTIVDKERIFELFRAYLHGWKDNEIFPQDHPPRGWSDFRRTRFSQLLWAYYGIRILPEDPLLNQLMDRYIAEWKSYGP